MVQALYLGLIEELQYLPDDVRWLMMSEGRPCEMNWLIFTPQK